MTRVFKALVLYCGLSLLLAPLTIFLVLPNIPSSLLGWLVVLVVPVPLFVTSEWLRQRLDNADLPLIDSFGRSIESSPYRLLLTVTLVVAAGGCGLGAVWLLSMIL